MRGCSVLSMALIAGACQGATSTGPDTDPGDETSREGPQMGGSTSDFGGDTVPCPCGALREPIYASATPAAVRVTVQAQTGDDRFALRLRDVLAGSVSLTPGETFEASWDGSFPCWAGCSGVSVGDEAFAFYWAEERTCPELERCLAECDAENAANDEDEYELRSECSDTYVTRGFESGRDCDPECEAQTADVCPDPPEADHRRGHVRLAPWTDPLVFARTDLGEVSVRLDDLDELWAFDRAMSGSRPGQLVACVERFGDWSQLLEYAP